MPTCTIPLKPCDSSQIKAYGYDATSQTLAIQFQRGAKVYLYPGVEPELAEQFTGAESKGKAFGSLIRGREFTFADLPEAEEAAKA